MEDSPWAARVEPHNPANPKRVFRFASAYNTPRQCLGPAPWTSGMLELEFQQWCGERGDWGRGQSDLQWGHIQTDDPCGVMRVCDPFNKCCPMGHPLIPHRNAACRITHEAPMAARRGPSQGNTLFWGQLPDKGLVADHLVVVNENEVHRAAACVVPFMIMRR